MARRILVLDRDAASGSAIKRTLGSSGYSVHTALRGREALGMLSEEEFDLLVLDAGIEDMGLREMFGEARRLRPGLDIVVVSASPSDEQAKEADRLGAMEYIAKPLKPEFMANVAERVFDRRGWEARRSFIGRYRDFITLSTQMDESALFSKDGAWARPIDGGRWEVGIDVRRWYLGGQMLCLDITEEDEVAPEEPFARLIVGEERMVKLFSPVGGRVIDRNTKANEAMCFLAGECLSEGWLLWILRVNPGAAP